jgi:hypothetical protein
MVGEKLLPIGSAFLAVLVLLGGIGPALYSYGQSHDHFVLGGPPAVGWEEHEHVNPLTVFLGPIASQSSVAESAEQLPTSVPLNRRSNVGRVVSVSPGSGPLLLTAIGIAVGPVVVDRFLGATGFITIVPDDYRLIAQAIRSPRPPPPR